MKTARKSKKHTKPVIPVLRRGAKSRAAKMPAEPVPVKRVAVKVEAPLLRADEPRVEAPKAPAPAPKIRDADGRVLPGLCLSRMTGALLAPGSVVPHGGADFHNEDRSVDFLPVGAIVPTSARA